VEIAVDNPSLFVHILDVSERNGTQEGKKVLPRDAIIHKDVENVLIPCVSPVFMASILALSLAEISA
jgi:hypothetical protein